MADNDAMRDYGVIERGTADTAAAVHAERIRVTGFTVLESGWDEERVKDLSGRLDSVIGRQIEEFGADRMTVIDDHLTARAVLVYDDAFLALARHPLVPRRSEFDRFTFRPPPLDRGPRQSIKTTAPGY